jgi:hypothetical protein
MPSTDLFAQFDRDLVIGYRGGSEWLVAHYRMLSAH